MKRFHEIRFCEKYWQIRDSEIQLYLKYMLFPVRCELLKYFAMPIIHYRDENVNKTAMKATSGSGERMAKVENP